MPLQSRKKRRQTAQTRGGQKLRELRQAAGLSLEDVAACIGTDLEKHIDAGHINKIETGRITKPTADTLEAILAGLQASYRDRRAVLETFGYKMLVTLPTAQEVDEAIQLAAYEVHDATTHPVFLVDLAQRLWDWNRYTPRTIGMHPSDPATSRFRGVTLFDLTFDPRFETRLLIDNPNEYLPEMLQFTKAGMYAFRAEPWYQELIATASAFPGFRHLWDSLPADPFRRISPIRLRLPEFGVLHFRVSVADLLLDPRFHMIHFIPYGAQTLRMCAEWAEEEGVL